MQYVVSAVPFVLLAAIVMLIVAGLRGKRLAFTLPSRAARPPRPPKRTKLTLHVSRDRMDDDLQELIRRTK